MNENINSIQNGSGKAFSIFRYFRRGIGTCVIRIAEVSARTWIEGSDEHEGCRICECAVHSRYVNFARFHRFPKRFQRLFVELEKFIEKQHSMMGQAYFSWSAKLPSSDDARHTGSMMNMPEGSAYHVRVFKDSSNRIYLRYFQPLFSGHFRKYSLQGACEHTFS